MTPEMLSLILLAAEQLVKHAPAIAAQIGAVLQKENPTPADWEALRANLKAYEAYGIQPPPAPEVQS